VPVAAGLSILLVLGAVVALLGLTVSSATPSGVKSVAAAGAAPVADSGPGLQDALQALLGLLFPPPPPPPPPAPPPPPPTEAQASSIVADAIGSVAVYANNSGGPVVNHIAATNDVGQRSAFLVVDSSVPGWFNVELPVKPSGSTGWIKASNVSIRTTTYYIRVHQSAFKLDLFNNGNLQQSFPVAVGAPSTPTPNGNAYVYESQPWNSAPYAVGIFALSVFSPVLENWPGGGRTGIHGWQDTSVLGSRASHGCVRMAGADFSVLMRSVPIGTPVEILP